MISIIIAILSFFPKKIITKINTRSHHFNKLSANYNFCNFFTKTILSVKIMSDKNNQNF